jgi:hypothetical protein
VAVASSALQQLSRRRSYQDDELERLQQLREHRLYQLYGILIVWHRSAEDDNPTNWRAVGQRRQQAVERYLEGLSPATMERAIRDLKIIAEQVRDESILRYIAMALTWPADTPEGWAIKFANPQDYLDILHNIQRLPSLDDGVQECLDRLG